MVWRQIDWERDQKAIHDICYSSGSKVTKQTFSYIGLMYHRLPPGKVFGEMTDKSFYVCTMAKEHWRLIEIAVAGDAQGCGYGREGLSRLLSQMQSHKVYKLTFRTPIVEEAQYFWTKMDARIVDFIPKANDLVMEINLKQ